VVTTVVANSALVKPTSSSAVRSRAAGSWWGQSGVTNSSRSTQSIIGAPAGRIQVESDLG
jgi:hypothetical protein